MASTRRRASRRASAASRRRRGHRARTGRRPPAGRRRRRRQPASSAQATSNGSWKNGDLVRCAHTTVHRRPPGATARARLANAAGGSAKNISPNRDSSTSAARSPGSHDVASAHTHSMPDDRDADAPRSSRAPRRRRSRAPVEPTQLGCPPGRRARAAPDVDHRLARSQPGRAEQQLGDGCQLDVEVVGHRHPPRRSGAAPLVRRLPVAGGRRPRRRGRRPPGHRR